MERLEEALSSVPRRPLVTLPQRARVRAASPTERRGASVADRMLVASSLLLVVSAAGLASGSRVEMIFLGVFGVGLLLTLLARRMMALEARAQKAATGRSPGR